MCFVLCIYLYRTTLFSHCSTSPTCLISTSLSFLLPLLNKSHLSYLFFSFITIEKECIGVIQEACMAQIRKLDLFTEIKCSPDKIFDVYKNGISLMPKISPAKLRSIEVLEGDGKSVGSVRLWNYVLGDSVVAKDKIDAIDVENKSITFDIIGGEITKYFISYKATIQVISGGGGTKNLVKWTVEYEKMNEDVPDPHAQVEFLVTMSREVDAYLLSLKP